MLPVLCIYFALFISFFHSILVSLALHVSAPLYALLYALICAPHYRFTPCSPPCSPPRSPPLRLECCRCYLRILAPNTANSHESLRRIFPTGWRPTIITAYSPSLGPLLTAAPDTATDEFDKRNGFFLRPIVYSTNLAHYAPSYPPYWLARKRWKAGHQKGITSIFAYRTNSYRAKTQSSDSAAHRT